MSEVHYQILFTFKTLTITVKESRREVADELFKAMNNKNIPEGAVVRFVGPIEGKVADGEVSSTENPYAEVYVTLLREVWRLCDGTVRMRTARRKQ